MALYVPGDLHLSFQANKPMDTHLQSLQKNAARRQ